MNRGEDLIEKLKESIIEIAKDPLAAGVEQYREEAEQGDALAQFLLGGSYETGMGVDKDMFTAVVWYCRSAKQGNGSAQFKIHECASRLLSRIYEGGFRFGQSVDEDDLAAVAWLRGEAKQGDELAQRVLDAAVEFYRKGAEKDGDEDYQCVLGFIYETGMVVDKDEVVAVEWYRKAAEQGDAQAQYHLGRTYWEGVSVDKDLDKAVEWYRKAAEQGDAAAQAALNDLE